MAHSLKLKSMDRRSFLRRGVQSGAAFVTLPLWSRLLFPDGEVPSGLQVPEPFALSAEDLRKLLQVALARGGEFAEVYLEYTVENSLGLDEDKISDATRGRGDGGGIPRHPGREDRLRFLRRPELSRGWRRRPRPPP